MRVLSCCAVPLVLVCADAQWIVARIATKQGVVPSAARRVPHDARSPDASRAKVPVEQRSCDQIAGGRSEQRGVRVRRCLDRCCAGRLRAADRGHRALRARWTVPHHQEDQRSATARRLRALPTPRRRPEGPENLPGWRLCTKAGRAGPRAHPNRDRLDKAHSSGPGGGAHSKTRVRVRVRICFGGQRSPGRLPRLGASDVCGHRVQVDDRSHAGARPAPD